MIHSRLGCTSRFPQLPISLSRRSLPSLSLSVASDRRLILWPSTRVSFSSCSAFNTSTAICVLVVNPSFLSTLVTCILIVPTCNFISRANSLFDNAFVAISIAICLSRSVSKSSIVAPITRKNGLQHPDLFWQLGRMGFNCMVIAAIAWVSGYPSLRALKEMPKRPSLRLIVNILERDTELIAQLLEHLELLSTEQIKSVARPIGTADTPRISELVPDVLKFDLRWVRETHSRVHYFTHYSLL